MRKKTTIRRTVWRLRCRKCGKKKTYYGKNLFTPSWEGWLLQDTELCPTCISKMSYNQRKKLFNTFKESEGFVQRFVGLALMIPMET